ncbi:MAG: EAL domain-containing protein [Spirochaetia bacterium]|nr:EAL domain-containing protein [Spirochaetia bacterium]
MSSETEYKQVLEQDKDVLAQLPEVVAEGVETKAQVEYLKAVGCDYIQGYYYSKPFPLTELITRIDSNYLLLN